MVEEGETGASEDAGVLGMTEELAATGVAGVEVTGRALAWGTEKGPERPRLASTRADDVGMATPSPRVGRAALGSTSQTPAVYAGQAMAVLVGWYAAI